MRIDPSAPRRWLLIKSEMPVPAPDTGTDQWSLDLLLADQDAIPTLIECKLGSNSESSRSILGQLLEYAANGGFYWTAEQLQRYAQQSNPDWRSITLSPVLQDDPSTFFQKMEEHLRAGRMRLILALDHASLRLQSTVEFLSKHLSNAQILLVELRPFKAGNEIFVMPRLFGPNDLQRRMRTAVIGQEARDTHEWDMPSFIAEVGSRGFKQTEATMQRAISAFSVPPWQLTYGRGSVDGALLISAPTVTARRFLTFDTRGKLYFNFSELVKDRDSPGVHLLWDALESFLTKDVGLKLPNDLPSRSPSLTFDEWAPHFESLLARLASTQLHAKTAQDSL